MNKRQIKTTKGHEISVTEFESSSDSNSVVILLPATGVKQSFYYKFAEFLQSNGYSTYTFDYFGIGDSKYRPLKEQDTSASDWGSNDFESVMSFYLEKYPKKKVSIIGHSIGGQLIGLAPSSVQANKIILIAAQSGYWKFWKGKGRVKMFFNWHLVFPLLTGLYGYFPGERFKIMENLPKTMSFEWRKWCLSPNYLFDHISYKDLYFDKIQCDLFSYSVKNDRFAPKESVNWITDKYCSTNQERRHLSSKDSNSKSIGHFSFFKEEMKETIWRMIIKDLGTSR
ncbi:MAG: alpha/beta fold hydrolase [Fluviicola sp.]|nr:alpha/beta fold hydrolase [Fluviicola sp.]